MSRRTTCRFCWGTVTALSPRRWSTIGLRAPQCGRGGRFQRRRQERPRSGELRIQQCLHPAGQWRRNLRKRLELCCRLDSDGRCGQGDFNGDGKSDLVVANQYSSNVSILLGNGDGTFAAAVNYAAADPLSVAVGDFNGDGKSDLAVANSGSNTVSILLGNGDGTFARR